MGSVGRSGVEAAGSPGVATFAKWEATRRGPRSRGRPGRRGLRTRPTRRGPAPRRRGRPSGDGPAGRARELDVPSAGPPRAGRVGRPRPRRRCSRGTRMSSTSSRQGTTSCPSPSTRRAIRTGSRTSRWATSRIARADLGSLPSGGDHGARAWLARDGARHDPALCRGLRRVARRHVERRARRGRRRRQLGPRSGGRHLHGRGERGERGRHDQRLRRRRGEHRDDGQRRRIGRLRHVGHGLLRELDGARERRRLRRLGHRLGRPDARRDGVLRARRQRRLARRLLRRRDRGVAHRARRTRTARRRSPPSAARTPGTMFEGSMQPAKMATFVDEPRGAHRDGLRRPRHRLGGRQPHAQRRTRRSQTSLVQALRAKSPGAIITLTAGLREREPARRPVVVRHHRGAARPHQPDDLRHVGRVRRAGRAGTRRRCTGTRTARRRPGSTRASRTTSRRACPAAKLGVGVGVLRRVLHGARHRAGAGARRIAGLGERRHDVVREHHGLVLRGERVPLRHRGAACRT